MAAILLVAVAVLGIPTGTLKGQSRPDPSPSDRTPARMAEGGLLSVRRSVMPTLVVRPDRWSMTRSQLPPLLQRREARWRIDPAGSDRRVGTPGSPGWRFAVQDEARPDPGLALAASAVLPGAGQFLLGNDRWVPYLAVELWSWITFLNRRSDARALAGDYRDLAWFVARRVSVGDRRDTIFEYYEEMTHFAASGTWDSDPETPGVQPELDRTTFNGDQWALARSLLFSGGTHFNPGATPYRSATNMLGLILVNHIVSAVDALVVGRLQSTPAESRQLRIGSGFERGIHGATRLRIQATWRW
jgi:hypothetical protein